MNTLLDGEWLLFECRNCVRSLEIDNYVRSAFHLETQRRNDDFARIVGIGDAVASCTKTKRFLPLAKRFIILI